MDQYLIFFLFINGRTEASTTDNGPWQKFFLASASKAKNL